MQPSPLNIVVFQEEQSFRTQQSRVNGKANVDFMNQSNLIYNQLALLADKIEQIERQSHHLQESYKVKSEGNISDTTQLTSNHAHMEQLVKLIEKKIKIIVKETKTLLEKITTDVDKKINQLTKQRKHQSSTIMKIQNHCRQTISQIENQYQKDLQRIHHQHKTVQHQMIKAVEEIQLKFQGKMSEFQSKEQQYLSTIQHLENKLKHIQKNKKMLEVTQEKSNPPLQCNVLQNISGVSNTPPIGTIPPLDTSKRRTRIFDSKRSNKSVSPNQILSPTLVRPTQTQSVSKPLAQVPVHQKPIMKESVKESKCESSVKNDYQKKETTESSRPSKMKEFSYQQFYRDLPKANWERFQDYDDNGSSGSEEDVFFYPEHTKKQQPKAVFEYEAGNDNTDEKMYSPFDVN